MQADFSELLANYQPSRSTMELIKHTPILFLVGPTGAGKDSLKDKLLATGQYHHIVSHTTRPPRINHGVPEQDGREYHFINLNVAEQMIRDHAFVEVKQYSSNIYATSAAELQAAHNEHKIALTDIEVKGIAEYKALDKNVMAIFLLPPDFTTWQSRLQRRYGDVVDAEDHRKRLETGLDEIEQLLNTDNYIAVINDDIEDAFTEIQAYVANRSRNKQHDDAVLATAQQLAADIKAHLAQA